VPVGGCDVGDRYGDIVAVVGGVVPVADGKAAVGETVAPCVAVCVAIAVVVGVPVGVPVDVLVDVLVGVASQGEPVSLSPAAGEAAA
jgi:hypothetical protein